APSSRYRAPRGDHGAPAQTAASATGTSRRSRVLEAAKSTTAEAARPMPAPLLWVAIQPDSRIATAEHAPPRATGCSVLRDASATAGQIPTAKNAAWAFG